MTLHRSILLKGIKGFLSRYVVTRDKFGFIHKTSVLCPPLTISGGKNIFIHENVAIGADCLLYATHAKITIRRGLVAAKGLKIITGGHERRIGRMLYSITDADKDLSIGLDKDIIIEEDVWAGMDVMILKGVTIGRGCTLAARSVVTRSTPPYSIVGGTPARFIKFYWTIDQILEHESNLYQEDERYTRTQLEEIFSKYVSIK